MKPLAHGSCCTFLSLRALDGPAGNIGNTGTGNAARDEEGRREGAPIKSPAYEMLGLMMSIINVESGYQQLPNVHNIWLAVC